MDAASAGAFTEFIYIGAAAIALSGIAALIARGAMNRGGKRKKPVGGKLKPMNRQGLLRKASAGAEGSGRQMASKRAAMMTPSFESPAVHDFTKNTANIQDESVRINIMANAQRHISQQETSMHQHMNFPQL